MSISFGFVQMKNFILFDKSNKTTNCMRIVDIVRYGPFLLFLLYKAGC